MYTITSPKLMALHVAVSLTTAKEFSEGVSGCTQLVPGYYGALAHSNYASMRIPVGRLAGVKPNVHTARRKYPGIQKNSRDGKPLDSAYIVEGSTLMTRDDTSLARLGSDNNVNEDSGRHFLFDKKWKNDRMFSKYDFRDERLPRPSGFIPPLPRDYQMHRSGNLHRYALRKELSHGPARPFTLASYEGYDLTSGPAILLPSAISLNGRHPFSIDGYKHKQRVNNRTCSPFAIGANQKNQTYPDPVSGAPAWFVQRLSEISSLEGETVRQEKIKKLKKSKKQEP